MIYDDLDAMKKFEPKHRLVRAGLKEASQNRESKSRRRRTDSRRCAYLRSPRRCKLVDLYWKRVIIGSGRTMCSQIICKFRLLLSLKENKSVSRDSTIYCYYLYLNLKRKPAHFCSSFLLKRFKILIDDGHRQQNTCTASNCTHKICNNRQHPDAHTPKRCRWPGCICSTLCKLDSR